MMVEQVKEKDGETGQVQEGGQIAPAISSTQPRTTLNANVKLSTTPPVVQVFTIAREIFAKTLNKYQLMREMERADPELYGDIHDFAHTVCSCYVGIVVKSGKNLDAKEEFLLGKATELAELYRLKTRFYTIGKHLIRDGNCVFCTDISKTLKIDASATSAQLQENTDVEKTSADTIVTKLQMLPMTYLTAVDDRTQVNGSKDIQIFGANYFILNESSDTKRMVYPKDVILQFRLEEEGEEVSDLMGRYTFGVWSEGPLTALKLTVLYKRSSTLDDMTWRHRMLPREHHQVPLDAFIPENYAGTPEQKIESAKNAALEELRSYGGLLQNIDPDQHYITGTDIKIDMVEPRSTTYKDPNEAIEQHNRSIHRATGLPPLTGSVTTSYAYGLIISSYSTLRAKNVAEYIKTVFEPFIRKQLKLRSDRGDYGMGDQSITFTDEELSKVSIKLQLVLDKDRSEMIRRSSMMAETGSFLQNEIRDEAGYPPLGEKEKENVVQTPRSRTRTPGEVSGDEDQRTNAQDWPLTPESSERTRKGGE